MRRAFMVAWTYRFVAFRHVMSVVLGALLVPSAVNAHPITFSLVGTGTGELNNVFFTNAVVDVEVYADTINVQSCDQDPILIDCLPAILTTVTIAGVGSDTLESGLGVFANHNGNTGFGLQHFMSSDMTDIYDPVFATYDLATNFGPKNYGRGFFGTNPVVGVVPLEGGAMTSSGGLYFTEFNNLTLTATVPEPTTLLLMMTGLGGLVGRRRRPWQYPRRRKTDLATESDTFVSELDSYSTSARH